MPTTTLPLQLYCRAAPEVRAEEDGKNQRIAGYGAVFYDGTAETEFRLFDDLIERVLPGAFDEAMAADADVKSAFNHDPNIVLGRTTNDTLKLSQDKRGLFYEVTPPDTQAARDVVATVARGDVNGSSFSFDILERVFREEKQNEVRVTIVELVKVRLFEVGPVLFPAYESTSSELRDRHAPLRKIAQETNRPRVPRSVLEKQLALRGRA